MTPVFPARLSALILSAAIASSAQGRWTWLNPRPQGHDFYGAAWDGERFVAVGAFGTVATSPDGAIWTAGWSGSGRRLLSVTCGLPSAPGAARLVAVGEAGTILASGDGAAWTPRNSGTDRELSGAAYGAGLFVAVGEGGIILTSPDGSEWTKRESPAEDPLAAVAWADTQFVAVSGAAILTSPDGIAWTRRESGVGKVLRGVGWGNGLIVAVGDDAVILTSEDGRDWTARNRGIWQLRSVAWAGDRFVAAGKYGYARMSRDGIAWDSVYVGTGDDFNALAWSGGPGAGGALVLAGHAGALASSRDFSAWQSANAGTRSILRALAGDGAGRYVAAGDDGVILAGTGSSFLPRASRGENGFRAVARSPRKWLAAGWLGFSRSDDGLSWDSDTGRGYDPRYDIYALAWADSSPAGPGRFVAAGQGGIILASPDGSAWSRCDSGRARVLRALARSGGANGNPGRWVAVGEGPILASDDGCAWTAVHPGTAKALYAVAAGDGGFLAAGAGGVILASGDGKAWRPRNSGVSENLYAAAWTGREWIAAGQAGLILRSPDGEAWAAGFAGGSDWYAVIAADPAPGTADPVLLLAGSGGALLAARPEAPAGLRPGPGRRMARTGGPVLELPGVRHGSNGLLRYDLKGARRGSADACPGACGGRSGTPLILMR